MSAYINILKKKEKKKKEKDSWNQSTVAATDYSTAQCQHSGCTVLKHCSGTVAFIIKHLFSVVIGYMFIFYYFISTCKKLTRQ